MGNHAALKIKTNWMNFAGYQLQNGDRSMHIRTRGWSHAWPVLAHKLEKHQALKGLEPSVGGGVTLVAELTETTLMNLLSSHRAQSKKLKAWLIGLILPMIALLAFIPLGGGEVQSKKITISQPIDPCGVPTLEAWLMGTGTVVEARLEKSTSLGGVVVGTLECKGSRYSYTLGSKEPKRVISLKKLDS
jgi:hypothetical protein